MTLAEGRSSVLREFAIDNLDFANELRLSHDLQDREPGVHGRQVRPGLEEALLERAHGLRRRARPLTRPSSTLTSRILTPSYEKLLMHFIEAVLLKVGREPAVNGRQQIVRFDPPGLRAESRARLMAARNSSHFACCAWAIRIAF